jgi:hypothetical protein
MELLKNEMAQGYQKLADQLSGKKQWVLEEAKNKIEARMQMLNKCTEPPDPGRNAVAIYLKVH